MNHPQNCSSVDFFFLHHFAPLFETNKELLIKLFNNVIRIKLDVERCVVDLAYSTVIKRPSIRCSKQRNDSS